MQKKRAIVSAEAALNFPFGLLVDIVGLDPIDGWNLWRDSEGNLLRITKSKAVQVFPAKKEPKITKDVFRKAQPELIARYSYWVLSLFGNNESILCFLGNDGLLRVSYFKNSIWQYNVPSVLLGYQALRYVISGYIDIDPRKISSLKVSYLKDFRIEEAWASGYPTSDKDLRERIECHLINQKYREQLKQPEEMDSSLSK